MDALYSLGNVGERFTPDEWVDPKQLRHRLKAAQRLVTASKSGAQCFFSQGGNVGISVGSSLVARVSNVHRCASVWSCPICAPVVRAGRAKEISEAMNENAKRGGSAVLITATGPHSLVDPLEGLLSAVSQFGGAIGRGAPWQRFVQASGYIGSIRSVEITYGDNGWHPHVHALYFFDRQLPKSLLQRLRVHSFGAWQRHLTRLGFGVLHPIHGLDVRYATSPDELSRYMTDLSLTDFDVHGDGSSRQWSVGDEMARGHLKRSGLTPFDILRAYAVNGDVDALALWLEYEVATFGKRAIVWSKGLKDRFSVEDATDEDLSEVDVDDDVLVSVVVHDQVWNHLCWSGSVGILLRGLELWALAIVDGQAVADEPPELYDAYGREIPFAVLERV